MKISLIGTILLTTLYSNDYNATANAQQLGMYYQDYNSMMALTGAMAGFTFMFFSLMIFISIARGT